MDAGVIRPEATKAALDAYRRQNTKAKPRKPKERLAFTGYEVRRRATFLKGLEKLCDKYRVMLILAPCPEAGQAVDNEEPAAADLVEAAA